jgi:hypothetical protein
MLTASEVADILRVSPCWVYRHKYALGGFQPSPGGTVLFSENRIVSIKEGSYAIPDGKREMAGQAHDSREGQNQSLPDKTRSKKMGSKSGRGNVGKRKLPDPHGLLT